MLGMWQNLDKFAFEVVDMHDLLTQVARIAMYGRL